MSLSPQSYPRISDDNKKNEGLFDDRKAKDHPRKKIALSVLKTIIKQSIVLANKKSSRVILEVPEKLVAEKKVELFIKKGKELFEYFKKYYGDPASTAFDCLGKHYKNVALEQFRNRTLQKERMNSGWRYQYIAKACAAKSKRFDTVSDLGTQEADFNVSLQFKKEHRHLSIYVSVKNRTNTMGGQDWPKAITALENMARSDKNRSGPYLCVFGIAMTPGKRYIKKALQSSSPISINTEIWLADYFWPFFTNYTYKEIISAVLDVLVEENKHRTQYVGELTVPDELIEAFGECCRKNELLDEDGKFNDSQKLVELFCRSKPG